MRHRARGGRLRYRRSNSDAAVLECLSIALLTAWALLAGVPASMAVQPGEMLPDPALEKRARVISSELRCLVCQNQSIDDSDAPLAADLRRVVRERLTAHDTDAQVIDYIVARYGEFVLLKPRFELSTLLLWLTPFLVLLAGVVLVARSSKRTAPSQSDALSDEERPSWRRSSPASRTDNWIPVASCRETSKKSLRGGFCEIASRSPPDPTAGWCRHLRLPTVKIADMLL